MDLKTTRRAIYKTLHVFFPQIDVWSILTLNIENHSQFT